MAQPAPDETLNAIRQLRDEIRALTARVSLLENATFNGAVSTPPLATSVAAEGISDETVAMVSAAIAAFLGKRAPLRQIRLVSSPAWTQQGRATIQASHDL